MSIKRQDLNDAESIMLTMIDPFHDGDMVQIVMNVFNGLRDKLEDRESSFRVTVTCVAAVPVEELSYDDREANPQGDYLYIVKASNATIACERALDRFHGSVAIKVLDEDGGETTNNDLSVGNYDVVVTVGPSFTTQRVEANEAISAIGQQFPDIYRIGADIFMKNLDIQGSAELERRFRKIGIQEGVIEPTEEEAAEMTQKEPSEAEKLSLAELAGKVQKLAAQIEELDAKSESERAKAAESEVDAKVKIAEFLRGDNENQPEKQVRVS